MIRLFASLLVALALFFSPMAMEMGGGMAMAHSPMAKMDGCAGMDHSAPDNEKPDLKMNCAMACAAIPGSPADIGAHPASLKPADVALAPQVLTGIWPERETPPPRVAPEI